MKYVNNQETSSISDNRETSSHIHYHETSPDNHETSLCSTILQVDDNISLLGISLEKHSEAGLSIPVHVSKYRSQIPNKEPGRQPVL